MAVYTPVSLAEIMGQAGALKAQQQKGQLNDLAIQSAQTDQANTQGVNSTLQANPNASLADLVKAGGTQGIQASTQLNQARAGDLTAHYRQLFVAANQVANADDPIGAVAQVAPQFPAQYDAVHGQGAFAQLTPEQVKAQAANVAQQAMAGLVDPDKQFAAHQQMIEDHYKQEGPGGEAARNANTVNADNQRNAATIAAENARSAATRAVSMRGQDLENANRGVPAGYERDPANPTQLRPITGGPHDPNATAAGLDSRSSVMFNRVASSANEAVQSIKNISELPITTSSGLFGSAEPGKGLFDSVKSVLAQKVTGQDAQDYKTMVAGVARNLSTIETAGLAPNGSITGSMNNLILNEGDTQMTKLRKMAEMRQIVEQGLEPQLSNPKLGPTQKALIQGILSKVQEAVPFTHHDITQLQQSKDPQATIMDFAKQTGLPSSTPGWKVEKVAP